MEKILLQQIKNNYKNQKGPDFLEEDTHLITEYISRGLLNEKAFIKVEGGRGQTMCIQSLEEYPLTKEGEQQLGQSAIAEKASRFNEHPVMIAIGTLLTFSISIAAIIISILALVATRN